MNMLIYVLLVLIVVGVVLYLINNFLPMDAKIKTIVNVVVIVIVLVWLLLCVLPALVSWVP